MANFCKQFLTPIGSHSTGFCCNIMAPPQYIQQWDRHSLVHERSLGARPFRDFAQITEQKRTLRDKAATAIQSWQN